MTGRARGLYEVLITEALEAELSDLDERLAVQRGHLRPADAADRIALHVSRLVQRALTGVNDDERIGIGILLARQLLADIEARIAGAGLDELMRTVDMRPVWFRDDDGAVLFCAEEGGAWNVFSVAVTGGPPRPVRRLRRGRGSSPRLPAPNGSSSRATAPMSSPTSCSSTRAPSATSLQAGSRQALPA